MQILYRFILKQVLLTKLLTTVNTLFLVESTGFERDVLLLLSSMAHWCSWHCLRTQFVLYLMSVFKKERTLCTTYCVFSHYNSHLSRFCHGNYSYHLCVISMTSVPIHIVLEVGENRQKTKDKFLPLCCFVFFLYLESILKSEWRFGRDKNPYWASLVYSLVKD